METEKQSFRFLPMADKGGADRSSVEDEIMAAREAGKFPTTEEIRDKSYEELQAKYGQRFILRFFANSLNRFLGREDDLE